MTDQVDLLYLVHNRLAYTRESLETLLHNTNWERVARFVIYDDRSTDGTSAWLDTRLPRWSSSVKTAVVRGTFGGPVAVMLDFIEHESRADVFCKVDNDILLPPGWLDVALATWDAASPSLDLLGIEPMHQPVVPATTPLLGAHQSHGDTLKNDMDALGGSQIRSGAPAAHIGGIGLMRAAPFRDPPYLQPSGPGGRFGFTAWQTDQHPDLVKAWLVPPLPVALLDRLHFTPWSTLGREYVRRGWQRPWAQYDDTCRLQWAWWTPVYVNAAIAEAWQ